MLRVILLSLLFASPVLAQDSAQATLEAAGCGPSNVWFDVKTEKKLHPAPQPDAGMGLVYVIGDSSADHVSFSIRAPVKRFGVDGRWVGANGYRSYFFFSVEPGDHRLCTNVQSKLQRQVKSSTAATSFTAEAGRSYYFRTKTPERPVSVNEVKLVPVDAAEAQVLLSAAAFSTFHIKN